MSSADASIRLACMRLAIEAKHRLTKIEESQNILADRFAAFCGDKAVKLTALKLAVETADRRASAETVIAAAVAHVRFANNEPEPKPPPPKPKPVVAPRPPALRRPIGRKKDRSR